MTIVVGYTPNDYGRAAVQRGMDLARQGYSQLLVINGAVGDKYTDATFASSDDISNLVRLLDEAGIDHEVRQPVRGLDGAEEVLAAAEEVNAELIVIGLRPRTTVGKFLLGSTAQTILMRATCDVLVVKT